LKWGRIGAIKCEAVFEFAKSLTYQKRQHQLAAQQDYVQAKQRHAIEMCMGHGLDYIITDSPLILSLAYIPPDFPKSFKHFVLEMWNRYDNVNFFLKRTKSYQSYGRNQSLEEAIAIDNKIYAILTEHKIPFAIVEGCETGYNEILKLLLKDFNG